MASVYTAVSNRIFLEKLGNPRAADFQIHNFTHSQTHRWGVQGRILRDHVVWIVTAGQLKGEINGRPVQLLPDDFLWMQPGIPHTFAVPREQALLKNYALRFRLIEKGEGRERRKGGGLRVRKDFYQGVRDLQERELLNRALLAYRFPDAGGLLKIRYLLGAFFIDALREQRSLATERHGVFHLRELRNLNGWLDGNLKKGVGPSDMADFFNLTLDYFSRKFRAHFGIAPQDWLNREKLQRAASLLLETSLSIKEICHQVGFRDQRFFSRQFKAYYRRTPTDYRRG